MEKENHIQKQIALAHFCLLALCRSIAHTKSTAFADLFALALNARFSQYRMQLDARNSTEIINF